MNFPNIWESFFLKNQQNSVKINEKSDDGRSKQTQGETKNGTYSNSNQVPRADQLQRFPHKSYSLKRVNHAFVTNHL